MITVSSGYKTKLESQANDPRIRFLFYKDSVVKDTITAITIAFNENSPSADTITDSGNGLVAAGFQAGDGINVSGSSINDGNYTIDTVTAGTITLDSGDDLTDEIAGDTVTISTIITFNENTPSADTITDSGSHFVAAGFQADDVLMVAGTDYNGGRYTIDTVTAGTITLISTDDLIDETAGADVKIIASHTTYDGYVQEVSILRSDTRLSVGTVIVKLINANQTWNIFESDTANMTKTAQLDLYFAGDVEFIPYFTGTVEDVLFEGTLAILYIHDKMAKVFDTALGDGQTPVPLYDPGAGYYNPADMVWTILTAYGGLDDTVGTANVDIDYTSWLAWKTDCTTKNYAIRARFTGHSIRQALLAIANRVNSHIWVNHEGQFDFGPPYYSSSQTFSGADCLKIDLEISTAELLNKYIVWYGYQHEPGDRVWTTTPPNTPHTLEDSTSQANFGVKEFTEESTIVWHWNYDSAVSGATYKLIDLDSPVKWIIMEATMKGFITEIGDEITVSETLKGLSSETVRILEIQSLNLTKGTTVLKGVI